MNTAEKVLKIHNAESPSELNKLIGELSEEEMRKILFSMICVLKHWDKV